MDNLKSLALGLGIGYVASWLYFFITLSFFIGVLGKARGAFINYLLSCVVGLSITYFVGYSTKKDDLLN